MMAILRRLLVHLADAIRMKINTTILTSTKECSGSSCSSNANSSRRGKMVSATKRPSNSKGGKMGFTSQGWQNLAAMNLQSHTSLSFSGAGRRQAAPMTSQIKPGPGLLPAALSLSPITPEADPPVGPTGTPGATALAASLMSRMRHRAGLLLAALGMIRGRASQAHSCQSLRKPYSLQ